MTESDGTKLAAAKSPATAGDLAPRGAGVPQDGGAAEGEGNESRAAWLMGWVIGPGAVVGTIFVGGVLVGAHYHDSWISRLVMWTVSLFS